jgi:diacylglycerol kinase family enzyme
VTGTPVELSALPGPVVVIANPRASRLRGPRRGDRIVAEVAAWARAATGRVPLVVRVADRSSIDAAGADARRADAGLVVAVGGDGTVASVGVALAGSGIPLGIVPAGAGNVLATALGVPDDPEEAIRSLTGARRRSIDLGLASLPDPAGGPVIERGFTVAAGVGWDARVMEATAGADKERLGRLAYWVAALGLLGRLAPVPYRIEIDDERLELEATVALVANAGELVPGLVRPRLSIVPDDGLLDLLVLRVGSIPGGIRGALELLGRTELGGTPSGAAFRARGRRIRIATQPVQPRQVDGDTVGSGSLEATVRRSALEVLVP